MSNWIWLLFGLALIAVLAGLVSGALRWLQWQDPLGGGKLERAETIAFNTFMWTAIALVLSSLVLPLLLWWHA